MEYAAEQASNPGRLDHGGVGISPLDHGDRGFPDRENVSRLHQLTCVVAEHVNGAVERAKQVCFQRKHSAVLPGAEFSFAGLKHSGFAQRHHHALATINASKGSVVHPVDIHPDRIDPISNGSTCLTTEGDADLDAGAFAPLHDVSRPVAVSPGVLIRVMGRDPGFDRDIVEIRAADQHWVDLKLRHHHFHAFVRVADLNPSLQLKIISRWPDAPVQLTELQRR
ncbi:MAG: Uncharacterised protein [Synechococcus sp. MIT S9220]|nr:MAG: Uncharacterised protein [Synechococcus sp. MIT S9220]